MANSATLQAQLDAHKQAESVGLLDAVRVIAKSGDQKNGPQCVKDWNGLRFYYGERSGDHLRPFAEVTALSYSYPSGAQGKKFGKVETDKKKMHDDTVKDWKPMHPDTVCGSELLYEHSDLMDGITRALRSGPWVDDVLAEAERIRNLPPAPVAAAPLSSDPNFVPYP